MRIIIYNSSSFGGCFDYGKALHQAYSIHPEVKNAEWWLPKNSQVEESKGIRKLFIRDRPFFSGKLGKQIHFLYRILFNPIRLLLRLRAQPDSWVILNDFEQLTAFIWVPLFRNLLKGKHHFSILLHDPDRDAYPPSKRFSIYSMSKIMSLVNVAIYHDFLPDKPYYSNSCCQYLDLPHGFYQIPKPDKELEKKLRNIRSNEETFMAILGNIREEKNYHLAIAALPHLPNHHLLIAGSASNTRVNLNQYKNQARELGVENRIIWIEKFLTESEMAAVIECSDVILLNYAATFTSQSGILNLVAPFQKNLIVSNGQSSLASTMKKFQLGELVEPQSLDSLLHGLKKLHQEEKELKENWKEYLDYASWEKHVAKAVEIFKKVETHSP